MKTRDVAVGTTDKAGNDFLDALATARISGRIYGDVNANGQRDPGEPGLGLFTVFIHANNDGKLQTTEKSVVTDIFGNWSLTGLFAGTYSVRVLPVTGILATKPTGAVATIHLTPGQSASGIQFGERPIS